nr:uncharacterized protein LOC117277918 [Nicotiana tomentosiformis]
MLCNLGLVESNRVDFTTFQFKGAASRWWHTYELSRPTGSSTFTWAQFSYPFLDMYIPLTTKDELRGLFEHLKQGHMLVIEYEAIFTELSRHAAFLIPIEAVEIARRIERVCSQGRVVMMRDKSHQRSGSFRGTSSRGRGHQSKPVHFTQRGAHNAVSQSSFSSPVMSSFVLFQRAHTVLHWLRVPLVGSQDLKGSISHNNLFQLGLAMNTTRERGHSVRGCSGIGGQVGGSHTSGGQTHCNAFLGRPKAIASDAVITRMGLACHRDVFVLFDPGSTYSYMSSYFATYLYMPRGSLDNPIDVSRTVGDSIVVDRVYQSCVITIGGYETSVELIFLSMILRKKKLYDKFSDCEFFVGLGGVLGSREGFSSIVASLNKLNQKSAPLRWSDECAESLQKLKIALTTAPIFNGGSKEVTNGDDGILRLQGRICGHNVDGLRELILEEAHSSRYTILPGSTKLYCDLKRHYWWQRMKKDIVGSWHLVYITLLESHAAWVGHAGGAVYSISPSDGWAESFSIAEHVSQSRRKKAGRRNFPLRIHVGGVVFAERWELEHCVRLQGDTLTIEWCQAEGLASHLQSKARVRVGLDGHASCSRRGVGSLRWQKRQQLGGHLGLCNREGCVAIAMCIT